MSLLVLLSVLLLVVEASTLSRSAELTTGPEGCATKQLGHSDRGHVPVAIALQSHSLGCKVGVKDLCTETTDLAREVGGPTTDELVKNRTSTRDSHVDCLSECEANTTTNNCASTTANRASNSLAEVTSLAVEVVASLLKVVLNLVRNTPAKCSLDTSSLKGHGALEEVGSHLQLLRGSESRAVDERSNVTRTSALLLLLRLTLDLCSNTCEQGLVVVLVEGVRHIVSIGEAKKRQTVLSMESIVLLERHVVLHLDVSLTLGIEVRSIRKEVLENWGR